MTRIYWICADFNFRFGSAKAEADDDGFSLRLKTVTEHLSCFMFLNVEFFGTQILLIGEIFEIVIVLEIVLVLEVVFGTRMTEAEVLEAVVVRTRMKRVRLAEC
jgi:hypothetical protein